MTKYKSTTYEDLLWLAALLLVCSQRLINTSSTCKEQTYLGGSGSWRAGSLGAGAAAEAVDEEDDDLVTGRAPGATGSGLGDLHASIDWITPDSISTKAVVR